MEPIVLEINRLQPQWFMYLISTVPEVSFLSLSEMKTYRRSDTSWKNVYTLKKFRIHSQQQIQNKPKLLRTV